MVSKLKKPWHIILPMEAGQALPIALKNWHYCWITVTSFREEIMNIGILQDKVKTKRILFVGNGEERVWYGPSLMPRGNKET